MTKVNTVKSNTEKLRDSNQSSPASQHSSGRNSRTSNGVRIKEDKCKNCQLCIYFCPKGVLGISKKLNEQGFHPTKVMHAEKCSGCGICFLVCPDAAIEIYEKEPAKKQKD